MKSMTVAVLLASSLAGGMARAETTWKIDADHSSAMFAVKHLGLSTVRGEMGQVTGTLTYDDKDVTQSKVEATIDVKAINTREEKRDAHLKSDAFFDVEHFPTLTFTSTRVARGTGKGKLKVTGDLTIRGKTKSVVLDVDFTGDQLTAFKEKQMAASATTRINRQDFGVSWNSTVENVLLVGDEVAITIDMAFTTPVPDPPAAAASPAASPAR